MMNAHLRATTRTALLSAAVIAAIACNSSQVPTTAPNVAPTPSAPGSIAPSGLAGSPSPQAGSPGTGPGTEPGTGPSPSPTPVPPEQGGPAFTPPPAMEPQEDEACLAIVTRAEAQDALGQTVGDIEAQASDPSIQLNCIYRVGSGGWLLLTLASESVESSFETELAIASGQGQTPEMLDGLGDLAFYAAASATAPEQIVFIKGPAVVRLWNQTAETIGRPTFTSLAGAAEGRIEAEVRPAP